MSQIRYSSLQKDLLISMVNDGKHLKGFDNFYGEVQRYNDFVNRFLFEIKWTLDQLKGEISFCEGEIKTKKAQIEELKSGIKENQKKLHSEDKKAKESARSSISYSCEKIGVYEHDIVKLNERLNSLKEVYPDLERAYFQFVSYTHIVGDLHHRVIFSVDGFKRCSEEPVKAMKDAGALMDNYINTRSSGSSIMYTKIGLI